MEQGASYIWSGIMSSKDSLYKGYRWVLGNGMSINAIKDPWLKNNDGFCVSQNEDYDVGHVSVAEFIMPMSDKWDKGKVRNFFSEADARLILATNIPSGRCSELVIVWPGPEQRMGSIVLRRGINCGMIKT